MDKRLLVLASGMFAIGTDNFVVAGVLAQVSASLGVSVALALCRRLQWRFSPRQLFRRTPDT
jgi:hypothetical protein